MLKKIFLAFAFLSVNLMIFAVDFTNASHHDVKNSGKVWGIDISHHQNITSWSDLSDQKPNFIFMKASEGLTVRDRHYNERYAIAKKLGLMVGTYHFFSYRSSGRDQAKHFLTIAKYQEGDLPLVLDAEYKKNMPPPRIVTAELVRFLEYIYAKTGDKPMIYTSTHFYHKYLKHAVGNRYPLWIADYRREPDCDYHFWQSSEKFQLDGIKGFVDLNVFNGNKEDLEKLVKPAKSKKL